MVTAMVTLSDLVGLHWILDDDNKVVAVSDTIEWGTWFEKAGRTGRRFVAKDEVYGLRVSTVFIGIHMGGLQIGDDSEPVVFETMIFAGELSDIYQDRYVSWEEAVKGHNKAVEWSKPMKHPSTIYDDNAWQHPHYLGSEDHVFVIIHVADDLFWSEAQGKWLQRWQQTRTYSCEEAREHGSDKPQEGRWYAIGKRIDL